MIQVSDYFKNTIREYGRNISLRISFDDIVLEKEMIRSATKKFSAEMFRSCVQMINLELKGLYDLKSKRIEVEFGVKTHLETEYSYIEWGTFIVDNESIEQSIDKDTTKVTVYDLILLSHIRYDLEDVIYPITIKEYLELICARLGIEYDGNDFTNSDKLIDDDKYTPIPEATFRDALDEIAGVTGGIILISNGKLTVRYPQTTDLVFDKGVLRSLSISEKFGPVESVTLAREPQEDNVVYPENSTADMVNLRITNNQIMDKKRDDFIVNIFNQVDGLTFYPFEVTSSYGYLEPYDKVTLIDLDGNVYESLIMSSNVKIVSGIIEDIETVKPEAANTDYTRSSSIRKEFLNVELSVDKQQGEIAAIVEEQEEQEDKISQLIIDVDSIKTSVEKISGFSVIYNLNGDAGFDFWEFDSTGLLPSPDLLPDTSLLPWRRNMPTFVVKDYGSLSDTGLYFIVPGSAITQKSGYIVGGEKYSFRCKRVEGNARFRVYIQEWSDPDEELDEETLILDTQGRPQLYESASITLGSSTTFIKMRIESFDEEFGISELMFNQGDPRGYVKSPDDVYYFARSEMNQLADEIQLRVTKDEYEGEIKLLSDEISLKVGTGEIISAINLSPEEITIKASKISLEGLVTANSYFKILTDGSMEATHGKFSGDISASTININNKFKVDSSGNMTATGAKFSGDITGSEITGSTINVTTDLRVGNNIYVGTYTDRNTAKAMHLNDAFSIYSRNSVMNIGKYNSTSGAGLVDGTIQFRDTGAIYARATSFLRLAMNSEYIYMVDGSITASRSIVASSDKRLKKDIKQVDLAELFSAIDVKSFSYLNDDKKTIGVIAQDFIGNKYEDEVLTIGEDGYYAVDYNALNMAHIQVTKRLVDRVEELERKLS